MAEPDSVIEKACLQLALTCMMERQAVLADDVKDLAARFTAIGMQAVYKPLNRTPELVARAIRYLDNVHAIPPMRDDTDWFKYMLEAVVEIARPNTGLDKETLPFLDDLTEGIAIAREA